MRAAFEHSWSLLSTQEKKVFRKISLFRGGFSGKAAEKVTGASLGLLCSLVDKSLLRRDPSGRYEMLEVLRQYAEKKLSEVSQEKEEVRNLHCDYYVEFLRQKKEHLKARKQAEAIEEVAVEIENVRVAWYRIVEQGKKEKIEKCMGSLFSFYDIQSWFQEGKEIFGRLVERFQETEKDIFYGKALARHGSFLYRLGFYKNAEDLLKKSLSILRHFGDQKELAFSLNTLGIINYYLGDYTEARQMHEESLRIRREIDDQTGIASSLNTLGNVVHAQGLYIEAKKLYQGSLEIRRESGDHRRTASSLNNLAIVAYSQGDYAEAKGLFQESLAIEKLIGDKWGIAGSLNNLGTIAYSQKEYKEAKKLYEKSLAIYREIGHQWGIGNTLNSLGYVTCAQAEYQESEKLFYEALKTAIGIQLIPLELDVLVGMATLFTKKTKKEQALELLSLVLKHPASDKETKDDAERLLGELKAEIPAQRFAKIQKLGRSRKLEEVVDEILEKK
jgi:tetratricopeptide (TPR) repeat protein